MKGEQPMGHYLQQEEDLIENRGQPAAGPQIGGETGGILLDNHHYLDTSQQKQPETMVHDINQMYAVKTGGVLEQQQKLEYTEVH